MANMGVPCNVVENVAPTENNNVDDFKDLMQHRMSRIRSRPRSRPVMPHLHVRHEGSITIIRNEHGHRAPPTGATAPRLTILVENGCNNCMGVQTRYNCSRDGWRKSPTASDGCNNMESEDGGEAPDQEMQGSRHKVGSHRRSGNWMDATLQKAMDVITNHGMKMKGVARAFDIPASSLRDHLYGKTTSKQRSNLPTLKPDEEKKLVDYIFKMQDLGHPLTPVELRLKVALATQTRETPWSAIGVLGKGWLRRFRLRYPEIATRKSQGLEIARAHAVRLTEAESLYSNLEELYTTF